MSKNRFNSSAPPRHLPTEELLKQLGCTFVLRPDGDYDACGDINLGKKELTELPDLSRVHLRGNFSCNYNQLTTLRGAPQSVSGRFLCAHNQLTSLHYAPEIVGGTFSCADNLLTSLRYAPSTVGENFLCRGNKLVNLFDAPKEFRVLYSDHGDFDSYDDILDLEKERARRHARDAWHMAIEAIHIGRDSVTINQPTKITLPPSSYRCK